MREDIRSMRDVHGKIDDDGVPLCYTPRDWGRRVENIENVSTELSSVLGQILVEIKRHNEIVLKLVDKNGRH